VQSDAIVVLLQPIDFIVIQVIAANFQQFTLIGDLTKLNVIAQNSVTQHLDCVVE
jgi:hypothetical protein